MDGAYLLLAGSGTACRAPTGENETARTKNVVAVAPSIRRDCCVVLGAQAGMPVLLNGRNPVLMHRAFTCLFLFYQHTFFNILILGVDFLRTPCCGP